MFKILLTNKGKILFLNNKYNNLLTLNKGIIPTGDTTEGEWVLEEPEQEKTTFVEPVYINASVARTYGDSNILLFRNNNVFMVYDVNGNIISQNP